MTQLIWALAHQLRAGDVVLGVALFLLFTAAVVGAISLSRAEVPGWARSYCRFAWQLGALLGLEQAYELTRGRIPHETDIATLNAYQVLDFEWRHGFFVEARLQHFFLQFHGLMIGVDLFYVFGHLLVTLGVLIWIYVWRRQAYPYARNLIMIVTAIALLVFYLYPTAPPRMLPNYGFVDPAVLNHLAPAGGDQPESYTYNPYAAMPSLHVAYALVIAVALFAADRRLWLRLFAAVYPVSMAAAVVISGNHWLLDVAGACVTVAASAIMLAGFSAVAVRSRAALGARLQRGRQARAANLPAI